MLTEDLDKSYTFAMTSQQGRALSSVVEAERDACSESGQQASAEIAENLRQLVGQLDALLDHLKAIAEKIGDGRLVALSSDQARLLHSVLAFRYKEVDEQLGGHGWVHDLLAGLTEFANPVLQ